MPIVNSRLPVQRRRRPNYQRRRRGLGDVMCPDGSSQPTLNDCVAAGSYPSDTGIVPAPNSGPSLSQVLAAALPAGFTTLQEAIAQPGQVVKTPTTLIAGSGANIANIPGVSTVTSSTGLLIGGLVIGGLVLAMAMKK